MVQINNPDRTAEASEEAAAGEKKEPNPLAAIKVLSTKGTESSLLFSVPQSKNKNLLCEDQSFSI